MGHGPHLRPSAHSPRPRRRVAREVSRFCVGAEGKMTELGDGPVCLNFQVLLQGHSLCRTPFPPRQTQQGAGAAGRRCSGRGFSWIPGSARALAEALREEKQLPK